MRTPSSVAANPSRSRRADSTDSSLMGGSAREGSSEVPLAEGKGDKSALLDRAYDEFCQLIETGNPVDPDEFCGRFPAYQSSLYRLLDAHRFFRDNPLLLRNLEPVRWPEVGQSFLGFALIRELGQGAFARVFLAEEIALGGRRVAVKFSRHGAAEAGTLGRLNHPNVVPIYSVRSDPSSGLTAICMPYLGSATLCDVVDCMAASGSPPTAADAIGDALASRVDFDASVATPLRRGQGNSIDDIRRIALSLADALAFVHSKGVLHRDLKPSNVLLSTDGQPRLLDFNLSADEQADDIRFGGTLPYMSPEQLQSIFGSVAMAGAALDVRSDLYSLGVILYELLTGKHPFGPLPLNLNIEQLRVSLLERQYQGPPPLREANPRVDGRLAAIVERCLAFHRADRLESAAVLAAELRKGNSFPKRAWRWTRKRSWAARMTFAASLLAGIFVVLTLALRDPYSVREWHRGEERYRDGQYAESIDHLSRAIEADPNLTTAWFDRGRARQKRGEFSLALADFQKANERNPDGRTLACIAYCLASLKQHAEAITYFHQAIKSGYGPAEVFNDLGYSCMILGKYNESKTALDRAVDRDMNLQASYYNRALVHLHWTRNGREASAAPGLADIETALALGPPSADLFRDAACLYAVAARFDSALNCLMQAADHGLDPRQFQDDVAFEALRGNPGFQQLVLRQPPGNPRTKTIRLVDPINDSGNPAMGNQ